jgi:hypothetical protein
MKNVIVMYSHNTSADYLGDEVFPNDPGKMAPNLCSTTCFDKNNPSAQERRETFQTQDGIQYWHFKNKDVRYGQSWQDGCKNEEDIRYWIDGLDKKLEAEGRGESIDALVIPIGLSLSETGTLLSFVEEFKQRYPQAKVIVHNVTARNPVTNSADASRHFVRPLSREDCVMSMVDSTVISGNGAGDVNADNGKNYQLAKGVDVATVNVRQGQQQVNILRNALGIERLPEQPARSSRGL